MRSVVEKQITLTLSAPPGQASTDPNRRATYTAALLMYEELLDAAKAVDPIARPLPLFYALSQAGRAIVAAHGLDPQPRGHGLTQHGNVGEPITRMTVRPKDHPELFGAVAAILGSRLTGAVELGALWAALPDLADTPQNTAEWTPALFVWPLPADDFSQFVGEQAALVIPDIAQNEALADPVAFLARYPEAARLVAGWPPGGPFNYTKRSPRGYGPLVSFGTSAHGRVDEEVTEHRFDGEHWLIPTVGHEADTLAPLPLWWVLLFGLSLIARYEPATWRAALNVEKSPLAVPLEDLLDEALEAVPHWILWALLGRPYRLPRPPGR